MSDVSVISGTHFLYPAGIHVSKEPIKIMTVLGSCIAVCLYDGCLKVGGMNHFMLPLWNGQGLATPKYGNIAVEKLIQKMLELGCNKQHLTAKIFGGAELFNTSGQYSVGSRNVEFVNEAISNHHISIASFNTGGKLGRKIAFNTYTGEVKMSFINQTNLQEKK